MKFSCLILIYSVLFSLNSFATTVPLSKPKIDALNSVLANEQMAASEEDEEEMAIAEEQNRQESEGYFERSNDPYISEAHRGGNNKEVVAGKTIEAAEAEETDDSDDF